MLLVPQGQWEDQAKAGLDSGSLFSLDLVPRASLVTRDVQLGERMQTLKWLEVCGEDDVFISHMAPRTHPMQNLHLAWDSFHMFPLETEGALPFSSSAGQRGFSAVEMPLFNWVF